MKRLIFFLVIMICGIFAQTASAQTYGSSYNYGYAPPANGYNYGSYPAPTYGGGYAPSYYYGGSPYTGQTPYAPQSSYSTPQSPYPGAYLAPPQSTVGYTSNNYLSAPNYQAFIREHTKKDYGKNPPVEIWLDMRIGRIGDYWFEALGGSSKHPTPTGKYTVKSKYEDFYSRKYEAKMPYSVFFTEQCAIHEGSLRVRSHGCIHVSAEAARKIYRYAEVGKSKVRVHK